jgi:hypothetical protein
MADIYSTLFFAAHDLNGSSPDLGPAAGKLWILRDLDCVNGEFLNNVLLKGSAGQVIWAHSFGGTIAFDYASFRGRQVIAFGQTCSISTTAAMDVTLSGYELTAP